MTTVTIRHVPPEVRDELAGRAGRSGRSLQEYLLGELTALASRPTVADVLARARERSRDSTITVEQVLSDLRADRRR